MVSTESMEGVIDLNADVGEVEDPADLEVDLFEIITSANIATGGHSGNPEVMAAAVRCAVRLGVSIGAHPSYPDRANFGRTAMEMDPEALRSELTAQIGLLDSICRMNGGQLRHVKPHGALYHRILSDEPTAVTVARSVAEVPGAVLVAQAGHEDLVRRAADDAGVRVVLEAFADRGYRSDGTLVPRGGPGDLLTDPQLAAAQAVSIGLHHQVRTEDGASVHLDARTLCIHGDTPGAASIGRAVRARLQAAGITVSSDY